jgi:hypothetical protein
MSALGFCRECGNMIQKHYHYCPFCGDPQKGVPETDVRPPASPRINDPVTRTQGYLFRLNKLEQRLNRLDDELDTLLERHPTPDPVVTAAEITP